MNRTARFWVPAVASLSLLVSVTGCSKLQARDQLNKGVQAYKSGKFEEAIDHFQQAVNKDPSLKMTHLYLATAYAQQVVPATDSPANNKVAQQAINAYQDVLKEDPNDTTALKGIASIYFNTNKFDEAKKWQQKVLSADPKDAEAYYTIGVIDWGQARKNSMTVLSANGLTDKGDGNPTLPKKECQKLVEQNTPLVDEALDSLHKAIELRPNYEDAMAYINLAYRRKAELDCGDDAARKADLQQAQDWTEKAMAARKANQQKANSSSAGGASTGGK
jgi:tetratricopeptide (TPR) repeat protein